MMNRRTFLATSSAALLAPRAEGAEIGYVSAATRVAVMADPVGYLPGLYSRVRPLFLADLGAGFNPIPEAIVKLAFSSVLAFDLKPYGNDNPMTLEDCVAAESLNCDNYCILAAEFSRVLGGADPSIVGWNGGVVGNHAQLLASAEGHNLLTDPTIGFVSKDVNLDSLGRGSVPTVGRYKSFFDFNAGRSPDMSGFNTSVVNAILNGSFKTSDLLYYAPNIDRFRSMGGSETWATPQGWAIK